MSIKTIDEKIAAVAAQINKLGEKLAALEAEKANTIDYSGVVAGATISFEYGKGEGRRNLTGVVQAVKAAEGKAPAAAKVLVGEGFDAVFLTVPFSTIRKVAAA